MNQAQTVNIMINGKVAEAMYLATSKAMDVMMSEVVRWGTSGLVDEAVDMAVEEALK